MYIDMRWILKNTKVQKHFTCNMLCSVLKREVDSAGKLCGWQAELNLLLLLLLLLQAELTSSCQNHCSHSVKRFTLQCIYQKVLFTSVSIQPHLRAPQYSATFMSEAFLLHAWWAIVDSQDIEDIAKWFASCVAFQYPCCWYASST